MNNQEIVQLLNQLLIRMAAVEAAIASRNANQIKLPIDDVSRSVLLQAFPAFTKVGTGTYGTQSATVSGGAVTVPAQPSGTVKINIGGTVYELVLK